MDKKFEKLYSQESFDSLHFVVTLTENSLTLLAANKVNGKRYQVIYHKTDPSLPGASSLEKIYDSLLAFFEKQEEFKGKVEIKEREPGEEVTSEKIEQMLLCIKYHNKFVDMKYNFILRCITISDMERLEYVICDQKNEINLLKIKIDDQKDEIKSLKNKMNELENQLKKINLDQYHFNEEGESLFLMRGNQTLACFSTGFDRLQLYQNNNRTTPYWYFNCQSNYGKWPPS